MVIRQFACRVIVHGQQDDIAVVDQAADILRCQVLFDGLEGE